AYGLKMCREAIKFKADVAVIEEGTTHWFVWKLLSLFKIKTIASLKCTLWPIYFKLNQKQKILNFLNRSFFKNHTSALVSISQAINDQILHLTGSHHPPIYLFYPVYKKEIFARIPPPDYTHRPFRVLFVGRMIGYKGIFDVLEIAKRFQKNEIK